MTGSPRARWSASERGRADGVTRRGARRTVLGIVAVLSAAATLPASTASADDGAASGVPAPPGEAPALPAEPAIEGSAAAPELGSRWSIAGSLRGGLWSSDRRLTEPVGYGSAAVWLQSSYRPIDAARLLAEGWVGNGAFAGVGNFGVLREAWGELTLGPLDVRAGKQILAWGRADHLNPTDNLSPRNLTLLTVHDDDQRLGALAVRSVLHLGGWSVIGVWLPRFEGNVVPLPGGETLPDATDTYARSWAVKVDREGGVIDWSVSWYDGLALQPDVALIPAAPVPDVRLIHQHVRVLGADASTTVGAVGLRAEVAYTRTEDAGGTDPLVANPFWYAVLGADRTWLRSLNVNLQAFARITRHFVPLSRVPPQLSRLAALDYELAGQIDAEQVGYALRVSHRWLDDALEAEVTFVQLFPRADYLARPRLSYAVNDHWRTTAGADLYEGSAGSYFGQVSTNSMFFAVLSYVF
jgi:hypothetical protein